MTGVDLAAITGILEPVSPREEILRTCALLMAPGDVHEVRIPKAGRYGTISGYFDNPELLADAVLQWDGHVPGVYITLNPCNPALLARAANRLKTRAEFTTADHDILCRNWLLADSDPVRPAGISSTEYEHGRAITVACAVWDDFRGSLGDPALADSGNGAHSLYPLKLPNTPEAAEEVKQILVSINEYSAPQDVKVDLTVYNAARITKLYGTMACKGDSTESRPHRRSRLLEIPPSLIRGNIR